MNLFFISDTHFGHANILTFTGVNGENIRSFASVEEMDETMVERWNKTVKPTDHIYHLGDVTIHKRYLTTVKRLNGRKRLLRGNHDVFKTKDYLACGFEEISAYRVFQPFIFCHIPIHPASLGRFGANVHGHIHERSLDDPRYINVSVEQIDYTPISLDELRAKMEPPQ